MWSHNDVSAASGDTKQFNPPDGGSLALDYSALAVEGHPGLTMVVFTPATSADAERLDALIRR